MFIMLSCLLKMLGDIISMISHNSQIFGYIFTFLHIFLQVGDTFLACTFVDLHVHWLIDLFCFFSQKNNKQNMSPIILALVLFEYII